MVVFRGQEIHKMLFRLANREDSDLTASSGRQLVLEIFDNFRPPLENYFFYFSSKTYVVDTQKNRPIHLNSLVRK